LNWNFQYHGGPLTIETKEPTKSIPDSFPGHDVGSGGGGGVYDDAVDDSDDEEWQALIDTTHPKMDPYDIDHNENDEEIDTDEVLSVTDVSGNKSGNPFKVPDGWLTNNDDDMKGI
jgi:hypothetical protein